VPVIANKRRWLLAIVLHSRVMKLYAILRKKNSICVYMICVVVDSDESDLQESLLYLKSSAGFKRVITFSVANDAFLYEAQNPVDMMLLNLETPHIYEAMLEGKKFAPSRYVMFTAKTNNIDSRSLDAPKTKSRIIPKPIIVEKIRVLVSQLQQLLSSGSVDVDE